MTLLEFCDGLDKGTVSASEMFNCFKRGDFTAEEFNAFQREKALGPLEQLMVEFYNGELFRAQWCDFVAWCDGTDLYHDRQAAERYHKLAAAAGQKVLAIELYINAMVAPRRIHTKTLNESPTERAKILEAWNKRIDTNGWRSWPKQRG